LMEISIIDLVEIAACIIHPNFKLKVEVSSIKLYTRENYHRVN
jgi:hypothetical protein